ncbi:LPO_1073/Vpar_1526 family protein [Parashewanella tropica]|uniref:LPO_1073/Vpar_1526 family protein n=1 Tax=Parashewanella tropica TaxID=2547970 RepID=UPI001059FB4B|nr:LPO_1073/Vpar_1526 family protein [Parashewanella tropica]
MIKDKVQKQEAGDDSTNLQAQSIIVNQGITYSDAKDIALDVYKANFLQLSQDAAQVARERAEELTDNFLQKLQQENEPAVEAMNDPSMQAALYEAQKQYAKTGDKDLEGLLVDILVERAATSERTIHQIVLDEALEVAAKLTAEQMDALTINFLITRTSNGALSNLSAIPNYITTHLAPFLTNLRSETSCYEHLEYVGCGSLMHVGGLNSIELIYQAAYGGLFSKGFNNERLENEIAEPYSYPKLITNCLHDANLLQVNAVNVDVINQTCKNENIPEDIKQKFVNLFNSTLMNPQEIKEYLIKVSPEIEPLFKLWGNSGLSKLTLTTVGIAIAQANFRRKTGIKLELSIWVM